VGCHTLLQGIFATQGSNPHLLHWQVGSLPLSRLGSPGHVYTAQPQQTASAMLLKSTESSAPVGCDNLEGCDGVGGSEVQREGTCVHISILYVCISFPALEIGSSVLFFLDSIYMH